jgi:uncharacterized membrane protein
MFLFDEQCAWCVRDTFLWGALFISAIYIFKYRFIQNIKFKLVIFLCLPMILDGGLQLLATLISLNNQTQPFYESTNLIRSVTGSMFGIGIGFFFFPKINKELGNLP